MKAFNVCISTLVFLYWVFIFVGFIAGMSVHPIVVGVSFFLSVLLSLAVLVKDIAK